MSEERHEPGKRPLSPEMPGPEVKLSAELKGTEALLAALRPTAPTIDRDRIMYEAGAAAARARGARFAGVIRRATTFAALAATLLLGIWIGDRQARDQASTEAIVRDGGTESSTAAELTAPHDEAAPAELVPNSYADFRRHLATADLELPIHAAGSPEALPDAGGRRIRQIELLRSLN